MGMLVIKGQLTAYSQHTFTPFMHAYPWVEITKDDGQVVRVLGVNVLNDTQRAFDLNAEGEFFFETMRGQLGLTGLKQLWAIKRTDGVLGYSEGSIRGAMAASTFAVALPSCLFLIGFPFLLVGFGQLLNGIGVKARKRRLFYGSDAQEASKVRSLQPIEI